MHVLLLKVKVFFTLIRIVINGVKPFEPEEHTKHYLKNHIKCDDDPVPAKKRKPAKPPLVLELKSYGELYGQMMGQMKYYHQDEIHIWIALMCLDPFPYE